MVKVKPCIKVTPIETNLWLWYNCDFPRGNSCDYGDYCSIVHTFAAAIVHTINPASDALSLLLHSQA